MQLPLSAAGSSCSGRSEFITTVILSPGSIDGSEIVKVAVRIQESLSNCDGASSMNAITCNSWFSSDQLSSSARAGHFTPMNEGHNWSGDEN